MKNANFFKAIVIIVLLVVIVIGLNRILLIKGEDGLNQMQALYKQPENSIDVLFLGSSLVYCDVATGVLWDNYGIAAYDLGGAEAPAWVSYYQLKEALRHQRPKVICYETSISGMHSLLYQSDNWAAENNYGMRWNSNRVEQLRTNSENIETFYSRLNPLNIMHGRYRELSENDFVNTRDSVNYKGFDPRENVHKMETPDVDGVTGSLPCSEKAEEYIRKIIRLTKEEGIPLVLFSSPYQIGDIGQQSVNYIEAIAESEDVPFINFNTEYETMGLDFSSDFADSFHLNHTGNYKYTDYFGKLLKTTYDIPDRRGDADYLSWETDAGLQRQERNNIRIRQSDNADDIMAMTNNGYILFVINDGMAGIFENGKVVSLQEVSETAGGAPFQLTYNSDKDSFLFTEKTVNGDRMCSLLINNDEHLEFYGNIIFVYDTLNRQYVRWIYV